LTLPLRILLNIQQAPTLDSIHFRLLLLLIKILDQPPSYLVSFRRDIITPKFNSLLLLIIRKAKKEARSTIGEMKISNNQTWPPVILVSQ
jgi:hypothetical protein